MERLNAQIALALSADYHVTVLAPKGSRLDSSPSLRLCCCPWRGIAPFLVWATLFGAAHAVRRRPRWVIGGSGLVAPVVLVTALLAGANRAVYLHGLDIIVRSSLYQTIWLPAIRTMHRCVVNSQNTRELTVAAGVEPGRVRIVFPGVAIPDAQSAESSVSADEKFRRQFGLGPGPIMLSVGRFTPRKGLAEFIEHAMTLVLESCPSAQLAVIGDEAPDALNASGVGQRARVVEASRRVGVQASVHLLGPVADDVLSAAFRASSVHVFPGVSVAGDVEGFGMVAIEAASHGVPTVGFNVGGISDAVREGVSGSLVSEGDYAGLARRILEWTEADGDKARAACRVFASGFSWSAFGQAMRAALTSGDG